jgi:formate dehydrogenase subunit gamma
MRYLERHTRWQRAIHGATALLMVLMMLSGLALFHPALFFLSDLFGGGTWNRILHPFLGIVLAICFLLLFLRFVAFNGFTGDDGKWLRQLGDVLAKRDARLPEIGKYNAGEKLVFWGFTLCVVVLVVTGFLLWDAYFARGLPVGLRRLAAVAHALFAWAAVLLLIVHVYAAIWVRGTMRGMTDGRVTAGWAWKHHRKWFREQIGRQGAD